MNNKNYIIPEVKHHWDDGLFDRYKCKKEYKGWLFYIGKGTEGYEIRVFTPETMAFQGKREALVKIPISNDQEFRCWVEDFIVINKI